MFQKKSLYYALPAIVLSTLLVAAVIWAWTEPGETPPLGNVPAPINVSNVSQTKSGSLSVHGLTTTWLTASGNSLLATDAGKVGIGLSGPNYKLDVLGGDINVSGVYRKGGTAGTSVTCGAGNTPSGITISGGIITSAGSCAAIGGGSGGGTVTSIGAGTGLVASPNPITDTGTISLNTTAISACTDSTNHKIYWDSANNRLRCGTDRTGTLDCYLEQANCLKGVVTGVTCDEGDEEWVATGAGWTGGWENGNTDYPSDASDRWIFNNMNGTANHMCTVRCCRAQ